MAEIELTQYLRPNGRRKKITVEVQPEYQERAANMVLTCEVLTTGQVVFYARYPDEAEEAEDIEIAENGPGDNSPQNKLQLLINRVYERKRAVA